MLIRAEYEEQFGWYWETYAGESVTDAIEVDVEGLAFGTSEE